MKVIKLLLAVLLVLFIAIQFFPKQLPENMPAGVSDLIVSGAVPDQVAEIIRNSCYDCHSTETHYPWYSHVAPAAWMVGKDIQEGRQNLDFSAWGGYSVRNLIGRLDAIQKEVSSGDMPLHAYTLIHRKSKLDEEQVTAIVKWTEEYTEKILK